MKKYEYLICILLIFVLCYHYRNKSKNTLPIVKPRVVTPIEPIPVDIPEVDTNNCDIALHNALKNNKKLLIIFTADWCGYCRTLKRDLTTLDTTRYNICSVDIDDKNQNDLVSHFNITIVPTSIIVDPSSNKEIKRISGYVSDKYKSWLKE